MRQSWRLTISSALLYTLVFNLTFFIQELFLVVRKALTPGLRPTLFHNNHRWEGLHPLASLFQGTGALVPANEVGMAMDYFHMSPNAKAIAAWAVLAAMIPIYATAWRVRTVQRIGEPQPVSIIYPLAAVVALLLIFQLLLRPGIRFY